MRQVQGRGDQELDAVQVRPPILGAADHALFPPDDFPRGERARQLAGREVVDHLAPLAVDPAVGKDDVSLPAARGGERAKRAKEAAPFAPWTRVIGPLKSFRYTSTSPFPWNAWSM